MGGCTDDYTTINNMQEISQKTGYLLVNVDTGTQEFAGTGNGVNKGQTRQTDETDRRVADEDVTSGSHK